MIDKSYAKISAEGESFFSRFSEIIDGIQEWISGNSEGIASVLIGVHRYLVLTDAGWLLHHTTPLDLLGGEINSNTITPILNDYYINNWEIVAASFREKMTLVDVDDEAKATFSEALNAHGAGFYRCTVRVLFPEIERVVRNDIIKNAVLNNGKLKSIASIREVREALGKLSSSELNLFGDDLVFMQFGIMARHFYSPADKPDLIEKLSASPIPNRHAAMHGNVRYNTMQSSLAALIMAEFMFRAIAVLKAHPDIVERLTGDDQDGDGAMGQL